MVETPTSHPVPMPAIGVDNMVILHENVILLKHSMIVNAATMVAAPASEVVDMMEAIVVGVDTVAEGEEEVGGAMLLDHIMEIQMTLVSMIEVLQFPIGGIPILTVAVCVSSLII